MHVQRQNSRPDTGNRGKRVLEPAVKRAPRDVKVFAKIREALNNKLLQGKYFKHEKKITVPKHQGQQQAQLSKTTK